jgi:hypothetical protein
MLSATALGAGRFPGLSLDAPPEFQGQRGQARLMGGQQKPPRKSQLLGAGGGGQFVGSNREETQLLDSTC